MTSAWIHDQQISFKKARGALLQLKDSVEKAIGEHKKQLAKLIATRDSLK